MKHFLMLLIVLATNYSTSNIDEPVSLENNYLVKKEILTKDQVIEKINLETRVIISEIEVIIATKKHNTILKKRPFKILK